MRLWIYVKRATEQQASVVMPSAHHRVQFPSNRTAARVNDRLSIVEGCVPAPLPGPTRRAA